MTQNGLQSLRVECKSHKVVQYWFIIKFRWDHQEQSIVWSCMISSSNLQLIQFNLTICNHCNPILSHWACETLSVDPSGHGIQTSPLWRLEILRELDLIYGFPCPPSCEVCYLICASGRTSKLWRNIKELQKLVQKEMVEKHGKTSQQDPGARSCDLARKKSKTTLMPLYLNHSRPCGFQFERFGDPGDPFLECWTCLLNDNCHLRTKSFQFFQ